MTTTRHQAHIVYRGLQIEFIDNGYFCRISTRDIAIDADGAPDAYGPAQSPNDRHGCGTDSLTNAGYPTNQYEFIPDDWRDILVSDQGSPERPVQNDRGFYISKTSLCDDTIEDDTPGKFVDANTISYIVMPQFWIDNLGVKLGDLCLLWHGRLKRKTIAIVADTCPIDERLGEISIAAAFGLGADVANPRTGHNLPGNGDVYCYIFKDSRPALEWPLTNEFVQSFRTGLERRLAHQNKASSID